MCAYIKDLSGKRFGNLQVLSLAPKSGRGTRWLCQCDCGNKTIVARNNLVYGNTKSCGCLVGKANSRKKYGEKSIQKEDSQTKRLYQIWQGMKARCYNKNNKDYKYYGKLGVSICSEWKDNFEEFYYWSMANGYKENLTIDRINNDKGYSPDNCRWVEQSEQKGNRRNVKMYEYNGESASLAEWARKMGISYKTLYARIHRNGYSIKKALEMPTKK